MRLTPLPPSEDQTSIGNVLVRSGYCSNEDVKHAEEIQKKKLPIGEILIEIGAITRGQLGDALMQQKIERGKASRHEVSDYKRKLFGELTESAKSAEATTIAAMARIEGVGK